MQFNFSLIFENKLSYTTLILLIKNKIRIFFLIFMYRNNRLINFISSSLYSSQVCQSILKKLLALKLSTQKLCY